MAVDKNKISRLLAEGLSANAVANALGCHVATVYRVQAVDRAAARARDNPAPPLPGMVPVHFTLEGRELDLPFDPTSGACWLTQEEIADLFDTTQSNVSKHLDHIYEEGEVVRASSYADSSYELANGSRRTIGRYNLSAIIAVGMRISSKKGTEFRQKANQVVSQFIAKGFAVDEKRLADDAQMQADLWDLTSAARAGVRDALKVVTGIFARAIDYSPSGPDTRNFYRRLTNTLYYAVTGKVTGELLFRADHTKPHMGLQTCRDKDHKTRQDATTAANYLTRAELKRQHNLINILVTWADQRQLTRRPFTMNEALDKFLEIVAVMEHPVLSREDSLPPSWEGKNHAGKQFNLYSVAIRKGRHPDLFDKYV